MLDDDGWVHSYSLAAALRLAPRDHQGSNRSNNRSSSSGSGSSSSSDTFAANASGATQTLRPERSMEVASECRRGRKVRSEAIGLAHHPTENLMAVSSDDGVVRLLRA
jgi:hypothetical protein